LAPSISNRPMHDRQKAIRPDAAVRAEALPGSETRRKRSESWPA